MYIVDKSRQNWKIRLIYNQNNLTKMNIQKKILKGNKKKLLKIIEIIPNNRKIMKSRKIKGISGKYLDGLKK